VVLYRIILAQIETPGSMRFYTESYGYKWSLMGLCGSNKNHTGTSRAFRV
jgi:hypothetical protein